MNPTLSAYYQGDKLCIDYIDSSSPIYIFRLNYLSNNCLASQIDTMESNRLTQFGFSQNYVNQIVRHIKMWDHRDNMDVVIFPLCADI